jgi:phage tail sheath protein FI
VSSGVRTITGVPTAIAAFVGRAYRGPVDVPVRVQNWGDFERTFGGLRLGYPLGNAVYDFFRNGGGEALVVRMFTPVEADMPAIRTAANAVAVAATGADANAAATAAQDTAALITDEPGRSAAAAVAGIARERANEAGATAGDVQAAAQAAADRLSAETVARLPVDNITLKAASPGAWANSLRARIDHDNRPTDLPWMATFGIAQADLFNLTLRDTITGAEERYVNLTVRESPRRVDRVLAQQSSLMRADPDVVLPNAVPAAHAAATAAVWTDNAQSAGVPAASNGRNSDPLGDGVGSVAAQTGLYALDKADIFNILVIPPDDLAQDVPNDVAAAALDYCVLRRAMLILDPPLAWDSVADAEAGVRANPYGLNGTSTRNAAVYFPRVRTTNPLLNVVETTPPAGLIAGAYARTDAQRGVWKAPAGIDVALNGTQGLELVLTDEQNGVLNPLGVNCLRSFPIIGRVIWGARTLRGADVLADEYKYVPIRRLALFIEESLYRGTQWVVFEPNDEPLWSQIRLNVGAFMHDLFRQGAFQGQTPRDAYLVKCDKETTTQFDRDRGIVNIVVGFAPLKPAEFVILRIQQLTGQQAA